jgi:putative ABC transport system ATP-binding protein
MNDNTLIKAESISKDYVLDQYMVKAVKGVSLTVKMGEFVAIMGASGSGKSTFMNILGCLDRPTTGSYFLDGRDVSKLNKNELSFIRNKKIGFVFQSFNLIPRTSALENVEVPLYYHSSIFSGQKNRDKALKMLSALGLKNKENHTPSKLSGGEQQRVAIARALINDPILILADEPTGNLDSRTSYEIMNIFQELNSKNNITIVMVTHEPDIAQHSKRTILFKDGRVIKDEPVINRTFASEELLKLPSEII